MEATKDYKGYDLFMDVQDDLLQAWNRANTIANINDKLGAEDADNYHKSYGNVERMKVEMLLAMVSSSGKEEVQKRIMKTIELEEE